MDSELRASRGPGMTDAGSIFMKLGFRKDLSIQGWIVRSSLSSIRDTPLFYFFFPCNGAEWIIKSLEPNQQVHIVPESETLSCASFVLVCSTKKITSHPDVESAVLSTCQ
jgi:hypothetical protein